MATRLIGTDSAHPHLPPTVAAYYDIRHYGAVGDGATNDAAAITTTIAAATTNGGTVLIPRGRWAIASAITVPAGVNLIGEGSLWAADATLRASTLLCTAAAAKVIVDGGGGWFGNFIIDGNDVGTGPLLHRRLGAERLFQSILVNNSAGEAIRVDEAQNDVWFNCQTHRSTGAGITLDKGAGGNLFVACEFARTNSWHLIITETTGTGPYGHPSHNTFEHCLFEWQKTSMAQGSVAIHAGSYNVLRDCALQSLDGVSTATLLVDQTGVGASAEIQLENCQLYNSQTVGAGLTIQQTAGTVRLDGRTRFGWAVNGWKLDGGLAYVNGPIDYGAVTNKFHAGSALPGWVIKDLHTRPLALYLESTDLQALNIIRTGEANSRYSVNADGTTQWGPGGGTALDTTLYRAGAGILTCLNSYQIFGDLYVDGPLKHRSTTAGFYNATAVVKGTVTGSRGGNAALASLLTALANLGLITDSSTA